MLDDFNFMVGGEAGQGVQSVGLILAKTMVLSGYYVFADQDYENRVRGGHNYFRVRVSNKKVLSPAEKLDILVSLDSETMKIHKEEVKDNGRIIYDKKIIEVDPYDDKYIRIPLEKLVDDSVKNKIMSNTVAIGAAIGLSGCSFNLLEEVLRREFAKLGKKIVEDNISTAQVGYMFISKFNKENKICQLPKLADNSTRKMFLNGNDSIAIGAIFGGCKFIAGYPMTPTTSILEYLSDKSKQYDIVSVHVEDEIAAMNMAIGAAYTGIRSMVATSGGGFCLMVEGLALAGMTETPVVVVLGQRPGPATGMPTRTEQGELEFAIHAGHGEFPRVILAPAIAGEAFYAIIKALNLAEMYQVPVILLTDHHLSTSYVTVDRFDLKSIKINRGNLLIKDEVNEIVDYSRYSINDTGISPRAFPGLGKELVVVDSDEHDEAGHLIEDGKKRNEQNLKRLRKLSTLRDEIGKPYIQTRANSELTLIGWGSTYGAIKEAADLLEEDGVFVNIIHLSEIWPFPTKSVSLALKNNNRNIVIENNATAQLARLIRCETGNKISGNILKFDGRPFTSSHIVNELKKEVF